ncbi:MAG: hypothetical protein M3O62_07135 [Pseudomonadota bacterium]|nr:hypothetical protein [Pseudomonadota bacterium]
MNDTAEVVPFPEPPQSTASSLDELFPDGQIRLVEISVSNWGTFGGKAVHTARIDSDGTLVTGHTGAGKTTFIDAHQVLLLPPGSAYFNIAAAQADRRDRSLLTYVRGKWASTEDSNGRDVAKFKRPKDALSGVRAIYRTETGKEYTLAALFWIGSEGTSVQDVRRVYVVAQCNLSLKDLLNQVRGGGGSPKHSNLAKVYDGDERVRIVPEKFEPYALLARNLLSMENDNAPALLARAMGLKRIDDLTELVRTLVLEEPDTRDKAQKAIKEFDDLKSIHSELETARARQKGLSRLPEQLESLKKALDQRELLGKQKMALPAWYARQRIAILDDMLKALQVEINELLAAQECAEGGITRAVAARENAQRIFIAAGGDKLQNLREREKLEREKEKSAIRDRLYVEDQIKRSGLERNGAWTEASFGSIKRAAQAIVDGSENESRALDEQYESAILALKKKEAALQELVSEIQALEAKPDSLIDRDYQLMRAELCRELQAAADDMPFLGELIGVRKDQEKWQGAIERVLGFQRLRLLVEPDLGARLTDLLDRRHMGRRVGVEFVRVDTSMTVFKELSFLKKIEWKQHPFREWLKRYLSDYSLDCLDSTAAVRARPHSMSVTGIIHRRVGSFDKDDGIRIDDQRLWFMGFSNESKKAKLAADAGKLSNECTAAKDELDRVKKVRGELESRISAGKGLVTIDWDDIDVECRHAEALRVCRAIEEFEAAGVDLRKAEEDLNACKNAEDDARTSKSSIEITLTKRVEKKTQWGARSEGEAQKVARLVGVDDRVYASLDGRFSTMSKEVFISEMDRGSNDKEAQSTKSLSDENDEVNDTVSEIDRSVTSQIKLYRREYPIFAADLKDRSGLLDGHGLITLLEEWVAHYRELVDGKLPTLVERFQTSLNVQATQSLTVIFQTIKNQGEEIEERIEQINRVLRETDFRPGMYLVLAPIKLQQDAVQNFNNQQKMVMQMAVAGKPEEHFAAIKAIVATLEKATDPNTRGSKDSLSQLDARYRMDFAARVIDRVTGEPRDYMRNTGGKSGGEKESFSGSIVAAALAYVLTPSGGRRPIYCTVFLDEAFSNTSDLVAKRVLTVFRKLGLHLNLITPFKNVHLVRNYVKSAIIVSADPEMNSEISEATWEEIDRQLLRTSKELQVQATRLGVTFEEVTGAP